MPQPVHQGHIAMAESPKPEATPKQDKKHLDELLEEGLEESFPASDPVSISIEPEQT